MESRDATEKDGAGNQDSEEETHEEEQDEGRAVLRNSSDLFNLPRGDVHRQDGSFVSALMPQPLLQHPNLHVLCIANVCGICIHIYMS